MRYEKKVYSIFTISTGYQFLQYQQSEKPPLILNPHCWTKKNTTP